MVVMYREYVGRDKAAGWSLFEEAQGAGGRSKEGKFQVKREE
jgi:hypothetical protein